MATLSWRQTNNSFKYNAVSTSNGQKLILSLQWTPGETDLAVHGRLMVGERAFVSPLLGTFPMTTPRGRCVDQLMASQAFDPSWEAAKTWANQMVGKV